MNLSGHQSARMKSDSWLTPLEILQRLGEFDLDPCCPEQMPWKTAKRMISLPEDGLHARWEGRIWLNPPFGSVATEWLRKLALYGNGIALIPARTETRMFFECVWGQADGLLFIRGRPHFHYPDGSMASFNSGAPISLVAYGERNAKVLEESGLGMCVRWDKDRAREGVSISWEQHKNKERHEKSSRQ